jgi:chemotaxis protein CheZ
MGSVGAAVQRKIFRVEQMFGHHRAAQAPRAGDHPHEDQAGLARELTLLRDTIGRNRHELAALQGHAGEPRCARATYELGAAIDGMENATQKILKSTEIIDESAKTLAATMKTGYERGLAQDIQEQTMRIYETCNFQDLAGQRIGKAIAALSVIEKHVARMVALCDGGAAHVSATVTHSAGQRLLNGPRLDGDAGHASQRDIDKMFG